MKRQLCNTQENIKSFTAVQSVTGWICVMMNQKVIFATNGNRNRFAEPTSVRIGIGLIREFQNLGIGIGIIFVRWEVFANYSRIPEIFFLSIF